MLSNASSAARSGSVCWETGTGLPRWRQVQSCVSAAFAKSAEAFGCSALARARMRARSACRASSSSLREGADPLGLPHRREEAHIALHQQLGLARAGGRLDDEGPPNVEGGFSGGGVGDG